MSSFPYRLVTLGGSVALLALAACVGGCHRDASRPPARPAPPAVAIVPAPPVLPPAQSANKPPVPAVTPQVAKWTPAVILPKTVAKGPAPLVKSASPAPASSPLATAPPKKPQPPKVATVRVPPVKKPVAHGPVASVLKLPKTAQAPAADTNAFFEAAQERVPGQTLSVLYVKGEKEGRVRLLEMPEGADAAARPAAEVAHDLQAAFVQDPLLADHLTVTVQEGRASLALSNASHPLLVIDQDAADEQGLTPTLAAQAVIQTIRQNLGPRDRDLVVVPRNATPDAEMTPEQKQQRAQELRRLGDDAYLGQDRQRAALCYQQAMTLVPGYPVPFLRLAGLYHEQKQDDRARAVLQQALQSDGLNSRHRQAIRAHQAALKS